MEVIKKKIRKFRQLEQSVTTGISNNVGAEFKKSFVEEAVLDNYRQCRGIQSSLRMLNETRRGSWK